jgi:hypothetical protein
VVQIGSVNHRVAGISQGIPSLIVSKNEKDVHLIFIMVAGTILATG